VTRVVTAKASCCKDEPRCKRCPVVLKRLEGAGLAERVGKRTYILPEDLKKRAIKAFR